MSWIYWKYFNSKRTFHSSAVVGEKNVSTNTTSDDNIGSQDLNAVPLRKFDKRVFVWSGKFKRIEDVPDRAGRSAIAKAQSVCRIKVCNYMIIAVIIAAGFYVMSGKRDAQRGVSVSKMNKEWHEEYNAKYEEEQKKLNR